MENLILSVNVVIPLFLMMAAGYLLKRVGLFDKHTLNKMNTIVFNFFFAILMFYNTYTSSLSEAFNLGAIAFGVSTVLIIFAVGMIFVPRIIKDNPSRGVIIQAIYRSNFFLFGPAVVHHIFSDGSGGVVNIMVAIIVPLYNVLAVIIFETFRGGKVQAKKILLGIAKNPFVISSALGIIFQLLGVRLYPALQRAVFDVSRVATPLALVVLGGFFEFSDTKKWFKRAFTTTAVKLFVTPVIFVPIAILLGFRGPALASIFVMYGAPVAVSSFTMAVAMEGNAELAGQIMVFSSILGILSIFLGVFILKSFALI